MPESRFTDATAPFVNQAGQFVTGMPVGMAGHGLMQGMYGALRPVDNFIYSRRLMDNYSRERLAADEAGDTESIKSIDALITKGASKGDITGLSYYRGNEPGDLGSTASVMSKIGFDSKRLAPGHRLSLIGDYDLSKDSYPLLQRVLLRNQRNGVGDIHLVTDDGVPRMIKLNSDGTGKGSLSAIDKGIDMLRTELGNPDIPGRVSLFGTHYVPAIEFYKYPKGYLSNATESNAREATSLPFWKKFILNRMKIGTQLKPKWTYEEGALVRDSNEAVIDFLKNDVSKRAKIPFSETEMLDTYDIVTSLPDGVTGRTYQKTGRAEWPINASGETKVHEARHQKDPNVFNKAELKAAIDAAIRKGVSPTKKEIAPLSINQIPLKESQYKLLNQAYKLDDIDEAVASNTELRYSLYDLYSRIYDKTPSVSELNSFIDKLGRWDILRQYGVNGYLTKGIEPYKLLLPWVGDRKVKLVKQALKTVPATIPLVAELSQKKTANHQERNL